jgi:hypothetical protein
VRCHCCHEGLGYLGSRWHGQPEAQIGEEDMDAGLGLAFVPGRVIEVQIFLYYVHLFCREARYENEIFMKVDLEVE